MRLEENFPDQGSDAAREGTLGHALFENHILEYLGRKQGPLPQDLMHFDTVELREAAKEAADFAITRIENARSVCKDPLVLVEQRLDYSPWAKEGFGTGDLIILTDTYIEVADAKFGKGVFVEAKDNSQFRLYMLGALHTYGHLYGPTKMIGTVVQPRLSNYGSEELTVEELLQWANEVVMPRAKLAWDGKGDFVAGPHCSDGFCKARATCAARAEHNLAIAKADFALAPPELMTDEQIAKVLLVADDTAAWLKDVQTYALTQAVTHGRTFPGFKTVAGRSVRKYADADAVAHALLAAGVDEALIYERSLLGVTAVEKLLGKKRFEEVLAPFITKTDPKPVLVHDSDKREALSGLSSARLDFGGE